MSSTAQPGGMPRCFGPGSPTSSVPRVRPKAARHYPKGWPTSVRLHGPSWNMSATVPRAISAAARGFAPQRGPRARCRVAAAANAAFKSATPPPSVEYVASSCHVATCAAFRCRLRLHASFAADRVDATGYARPPRRGPQGRSAVSSHCPDPLRSESSWMASLSRRFIKTETCLPARFFCPLDLLSKALPAFGGLAFADAAPAAALLLFLPSAAGARAVWRSLHLISVATLQLSWDLVPDRAGRVVDLTCPLLEPVVRMVDTLGPSSL